MVPKRNQKRPRWYCLDKLEIPRDCLLSKSPTEVGDFLFLKIDLSENMLYSKTGGRLLSSFFSASYLSSSSLGVIEKPLD